MLAAIRHQHRYRLLNLLFETNLERLTYTLHIHTISNSKTTQPNTHFQSINHKIYNQKQFKINFTQKQHIHIVSTSKTTQPNACLQSINRRCHNLNRIKLNVNFRRTSLPDAKEGSYGSRFFPPSQIETAEDKIKEALRSHRLCTSQEWAEVKADLMDELSILTEVNFSSILMNCLLALNKLEEAQALVKYLEEANIEINFLAHLKFMDLCARNVELCGQDVILRSFRKVKPFIEAAPVMDLKRAEHLINGLCATDQWSRSLDYLKMVHGKPNSAIKNSIACAAIKNGDESLAWEVLTRWYRADWNERPSDKVFSEFFLYASRLGGKRSEDFLKRILLYMRQKGSVVGQDAIKVIKEVFDRHSNKWKTSFTKIDRDGTCEACKNSLFIVNFTPEDFISLRNSFLEKSLKKSDLFINSTEREFNNYIDFINHHKPFDVVLDALNAAHAFQGKRNPKLLALQLLKVVEALAKPPTRLLVLGKHHMRMWPIGIMKKIAQKAKMFLTSNTSQDDPFMVYAALVSGPNATIVSSDLMRDHMSRLDDPVLIQRFKSWQQTHQTYITVGDNNEPFFVKPLQYSINVQGSMDEGWHIPFDDGMALEPYEELNNWLCIQRIE